MATHEFRLPDPGEGLVEAEIVTWRVAVGDEVTINDIVVEIETSKSLVELPIPFAGTVTALLAEEGQMVDVGAPIIAVSDGVEEPDGPQEHTPSGKADFMPPLPGEKMPPSSNGESSDRVANLVGYGPRSSEARRRARRPAVAPPHASVSVPVAEEAPPETEVPAQAPVSANALPADPTSPAGDDAPALGRGPAVLAKPPVRKLARDRGVDLTTLTGSGPGGLITREDVDRATAPAPVVATPPATVAPAPVAAQVPARTADPARETR